MHFLLITIVAEAIVTIFDSFTIMNWQGIELIAQH